MTSQPIEAVYDGDGRLHVADAASFRTGLGHEPEPGETVLLTVAPKPRRKLTSSYGTLADLRDDFDDIDFAEIRQEMTDELRAAGKI